MALIVVLCFLGLIVSQVPLQMKEKEYQHMNVALSEFNNLKVTIDNQVLSADFSEGSSEGDMSLPVYTPVTLGAEGIPVFSEPTKGRIAVDPHKTDFTIQFDYASEWGLGSVEEVPQDVILIIDSSGSMNWNDPDNERLIAAEKYIDTLEKPDRVAIVDFDSEAYFVRENIGEEKHQLETEGHDGIPDYECAKADLYTIDSSGGTNFGWALEIANDELIEFGNKDHALVEILLTDGRNNRWYNNTQALNEAERARDNGIVIFTIGLGRARFRILERIAETAGGRYYNAPDPSYLEWIYYDISRRFTGSSTCPCMNITHSSSGQIELRVFNKQFPQQRIVYENGAILAKQKDGEIVLVGPTFDVVRTSNGNMTLSYRSISLSGKNDSVAGAGTRGITTRLVSYQKEDYVIEEVSLQEQNQRLYQLLQDIQEKVYTGGIITQSAGQDISFEIQEVKAAVEYAIAAEGENRTEAAMDWVDIAVGNIQDAIDKVNGQFENMSIQHWYAESLIQELDSIRCKLLGWKSWTKGISFVIVTKHKKAWSKWFSEMLYGVGEGRYSISSMKNGLTVTLRKVNSVHTEHASISVELR